MSRRTRAKNDYVPDDLILASRVWRGSKTSALRPSCRIESESEYTQQWTGRAQTYRGEIR